MFSHYIAKFMRVAKPEKPVKRLVFSHYIAKFMRVAKPVKSRRKRKNGHYIAKFMRVAKPQIYYTILLKFWYINLFFC